MAFERGCGILLHPTSLPGRFGIGGVGAEARRFVDFLVEAGQSLWQICPLGPTGFGDSPYQCFSAFGGNPLLIDLEELAGEGLLEREALDGAPEFPAKRVDYGPVIEWKSGVLDQLHQSFAQKAPPAVRDAFDAFREEQAAWLPDFALFMALKDEHGGAPWTAWKQPLLQRKPASLTAARKRLAGRIERHALTQFLFLRQWRALKQYANQRGVNILGDAPIFVAHDSADVWANQPLFHLDEAGQPTVVAGVPPDYFSETGQRWGNPLYRWDVLAESGFAWWIARFRALLQLIDIVRIDHFRGFQAYWEVPAEEETASNGRWVEAPGVEFFQTLEKELGDLPIVAEDLGIITPEVEALRDRFEFPGMKVLQFAFGGEPDHIYLPHNYRRNCVVYTGTHDNDTTRGWYDSAPIKVTDFLRRYMWVDGHNIAWDLLRLAYLSVADLAIAPLQDTLSLGSEGRMNTPGRADGNWSWRLRPEQLRADISHGLRDLAEITNRLPRG